jgi:hypothetical protein
MFDNLYEANYQNQPQSFTPMFFGIAGNDGWQMPPVQMEELPEGLIEDQI